MNEELVMKAVRTAECYDKVTMSIDTGPYDVTVPSAQAMRFANALESLMPNSASPSHERIGRLETAVKELREVLKDVFLGQSSTSSILKALKSTENV